MVPKKFPVLTCFDCGVSLAVEGAAAACPACGKRWPVRNGIPLFSGDFPYWGEIGREAFIALNDLARENGWRAAVELKAPHLVSAAASLSRADWAIGLPLERDWDVLDLGAGLGGVSFALAGRTGSVTALEPILERAEFLEIRRRQENVDNIRVVAASAHALPFPDESFDLVAMNGVLEWVALSAAGRPREIQESVLRRALRLLKKGGWLFLGIENRFSINSILGGRDHSGLAFTSLMPRPIADACVRLSAKRPFRSSVNRNGYRTYTYGYRGCRDLMTVSGFRDLRVLGALSYNRPAVLFDLDATAGFKFFLRDAYPRSAKGRFLRSIALPALSPAVLKFLAPCFCIMGRKT